MFSFLDTKAAKVFGTEMAHFYITRVPPEALLKEKEKQLASKAKQAMEKMADQITVFKKQNPLNIYKVAQMGNAFKWTLKDAGYAETYIDKLTQWFIVSVKL
nr:hypothetical protein [Rhodoferax sp.]